MRALAVLSVVVAIPAAAAAQTRIVSTLVTSSEQACIREIAARTPSSPGASFCTCDVESGCRTPAAYLTEIALGQGSAELERLAWHVLAALANAAHDDEKMALALGDLRRNYYRLVWKGLDIDGGATIYRVLLHDGGRAQPDNVLPGIRDGGKERLYDVLLTDIRITEEKDGTGVIERESPVNTLSSVYVSTRTANPLIAQIPDFIIKTNVLQFWASATGDRHRRTKPAGEQPTAAIRRGSRFTLYEVPLPDARATLKVTDYVITRTPDVDAIVETAEALAARFARPEVSTSACILRLSRAYVDSLKRAAPSCRITEPRTLVETREAARDCQDSLNRVLRETTDEARKSKECTTSDGWNEEITAAQLRFKSLVDAVGEGPVSSTSLLDNEPKTRVSFGVMAATTVGEPHVADGYVRSKVDGRVFAADPMPRLLTAAVVNLHPWPYQASSHTQSWRERVRTFVGVTITPDFGIAAGVGCSLVRGLTMNAGGALMWTNAVTADRVGKPIPADVDKNRPFTLKTAVVGLFGVGYSFK